MMRVLRHSRHGAFLCWGISVTVEVVYPSLLVKVLNSHSKGSRVKLAKLLWVVPKAPKWQQLTAPLHALRVLAMKKGV